MTDNDSPFDSFGLMEKQMGQDAYQANVAASAAQADMYKQQALHIEACTKTRHTINGLMAGAFFMLFPVYVLMLVWLAKAVF